MSSSQSGDDCDDQDDDFAQTYEVEESLKVESNSNLATKVDNKYSQRAIRKSIVFQD